jgi:hypothetical protein
MFEALLLLILFETISFFRLYTSSIFNQNPVSKADSTSVFGSGKRTELVNQYIVRNILSHCAHFKGYNRRVLFPHLKMSVFEAVYFYY